MAEKIREGIERIMITFKEFITEAKYDYEWDNDHLGYHVTKDGQRVRDAFYKAKSTFDRGAADAAAKKHAIKLRGADKDADQKQREHDYQHNKPLSQLETEWVGLHKKLVSSLKNKTSLSDQELKRYSDLGKIVRNSLSDGTHKVMKEEVELEEMSTKDIVDKHLARLHPSKHDQFKKHLAQAMKKVPFAAAISAAKVGVGMKEEVELEEMSTVRWAAVDSKGNPHYIDDDKKSVERVAKDNGMVVRQIFAPKPKNMLKAIPLKKI